MQVKNESVSNRSWRTGLALAALVVAVLGGCGHAPVESESVALAAEARHSTLLLVGLEDGSIVRQTLALDADICMKELNNSTTRCLTRGDAILNSEGLIVGYEMVSETIELQGRN